MSFPNWNSDPSFNKITSTYFKDLIDLSGNFIIRNGTIKSPANTIEFDDTYSFTNFLNSVNIYGQLKNTYNSIEYDVGLQCEKAESLLTDVASISPIVYDTQFKTTGFYWDSGLSSTVFNNNVSFLNASISSTAINNTSFVSKSGAESIDGIKTFNSPPVMSGGGINISSIPGNRVIGTAVSLTGTQTITSTKTFSVAQTFTNNLRLDGTLNVGTAGNVVLANSTLQKIAFISDVTSAVGQNLTSLQNQITSLNSVSLSASNIFTGATNQFSNTLRLDGDLKLNANTLTLTNANLQKIQYLSNITTDIKASLDTLTNLTSGFYRSETTGTYFFTSNLNTEGKFNTLTPYEIGNLTGTTEPLQIAIDALKTKTDTTNINLATTTTNANDALQRTTEISFSDTPTPQTTITSKCVTEELVFTTDLNDITPTTFSYLQGVNSSIQSQLDSKLSVIPGTIFQHIAGTLQEFFPYRYLLCNGQSVSRSEYNNLFQWIGTSFGSVDASSFNVPDYRCCFLRMYSSTTRVVEDVNYTTNAPNVIQKDSLEAHVHSSNLSGSYLNSSITNGTLFTAGLSRNGTTSFPSFTGGVSSSHRTSTETRPLNHSIYFYIHC